jgi:transcriptional regulator with XRE-family HTH domain
MTGERTFGQRLRATRIKAGYSQSDLEEISGIPKARLSRYENGHVAPSIQTLERLARALTVSEASLLGDDRALMEEFFHVLTSRGVRIDSSEQAVALGSAVADIARALGMVEEGEGAVADIARALGMVEEGEGAVADRSTLSPVGVAGTAAWSPDGS